MKSDNLGKLDEKTKKIITNKLNLEFKENSIIRIIESLLYGNKNFIELCKIAFPNSKKPQKTRVEEILDVLSPLIEKKEIYVLTKRGKEKYASLLLDRLARTFNYISTNESNEFKKMMKKIINPGILDLEKDITNLAEIESKTGFGGAQKILELIEEETIYIDPDSAIMKLNSITPKESIDFNFSSEFWKSLNEEFLKVVEEIEKREIERKKRGKKKRKHPLLIKKKEALILDRDKTFNFFIKTVDDKEIVINTQILRESEIFKEFLAHWLVKKIKEENLTRKVNRGNIMEIIKQIFKDAGLDPEFSDFVYKRFGIKTNLIKFKEKFEIVKTKEVREEKGGEIYQIKEIEYAYSFSFNDWLQIKAK